MKIGWKMSFSTIWLRKENKGESFPSGLTFFILSIWKENDKGKVLKNAFYTNIISLIPHFIHDLITFVFSHSYHFIFSHHNNVQVLFSPFFFPCLISTTTFLWVECNVNLPTMFLLVTKSFAQLNLYVRYCNFYIIIIKITI